MEFETFHGAYLSSLRSLTTGPVYRNAPRGFPSVEQVGVRYRIRDARQRIPMVPARRLNIVFNFAEALWYLSGRDDVEFIAHYAPGIRKYSADGRKLTGTAYGRAIFGGRRDQWRLVVDQLRADPDSKRGVLQIFRGEELAVPANPDVSCTLALQFLHRDAALHAVGFMRANDAYRGMCSDVFSFTLLQELLARQLGLEVGGYTHLVGSLHVYGSDAGRVEEVLADPAAARTEPELSFPAMPAGDNWPYVTEVLRLEEPLRLNRHRLGDPAALGLPAYWTQVALLLELHRCLRHGDAVDDAVPDALSPLNRWLVGRWRPELLAGAAATAGHPAR